jgi:arylsulfatase A-like enzyme
MRCAALLMLVSGAVPAGAVQAAGDRAKPNLLLIVSDDQGDADLGCIGAKPISTPTLDRLAADGVRGTSFYVTWSAWTPSRGSLLTGRYPQRNGLYDILGVAPKRDGLNACLRRSVVAVEDPADVPRTQPDAPF